ncbi:MAG: SDR family NAD(P)-dependent oxidoreductase [Chitinophagaceae bacterium]|jgi:NADP-dependent 3-hydroxy acid dehydrogenase YdfG|nr:SDR family NAD(P)-dependent oxidoreductase [Chitinophagaceae bacterium]MBL0070120.1 SDR family NAD(P)-dependent oxidoreductase [Chitinophagaceae bacterium]
MSKIVFITGATSGFGESAAYKFAAHGYDLILNGRRADRLQVLADELEKKYNVAVLQLPFDVQDEKAVFESIGHIPEDWKAIDVLVNNAGLALGRDYFEEGDLSDWNTMIDTNVKGFLYVAKAVSQLMVPRKQGHIINMGSVAGKQVYEKGNVYCASKYAVDAISQGMRIDLLRHNIKVTSINPGAAETEFSLVRFKGDEGTAKKIYDGLKPLTAEDVAEVIYYCTTLPSHVCINDLSITCTQQADAIFFNRSITG